MMLAIQWHSMSVILWLTTKGDSQMLMLMHQMDGYRFAIERP
ncbi:hypothetical protein OPW41_17030 [Vibrio europaeus]|uniref:Uncharacterized protein n=1 Tax=Vibrio europaeus TaxID=300876 RepID=A0ABT5GN19_9VIBR|nr:hypothetical protein [Vibrio europaeus]MDC5707612.1 hypothetical protein [Vibrio europaeus]MDC5709858.1 hypothetical protein [Vibrio europaeus]MDC5716665.1 hypothetical protein [Vibrio europaeus]MDC5722714.1 hypothetical protein [Vibrio europaeus]MDC5726985.1 hypothetical protein [Vibrio europaeus]